MGINKAFLVKITESKINKDYMLGDIWRSFSNVRCQISLTVICIYHAAIMLTFT